MGKNFAVSLPRIQWNSSEHLSKLNDSDSVLLYQFTYPLRVLIQPTAL
jgi:hypothetical protein